jgi:hypothetical protein
MSDKKVGRISRYPINPTEQMQRSLSDPGTVNAKDLPHDKGKTGVTDKFREREERWRREQSMHDQQANHAPEPAERPEAADRTGEQSGGGEGGEE